MTITEDATTTYAKVQSSVIDGLSAENKRLRAFAEFVLKWCDRGPPHGGPGNEVVALDAIRNHPVLRAMRASS